MTQPAGERVICSAKGCSHDATTALRWNNPRLHPPDRRKTWVACPDHVDYLTQYLATRSLLREVEPLPLADPRA